MSLPPDQSMGSELQIFTITFSHCLALQVAKDIQVFGLSPPPLSTALVAVTIVAAHISTHEAVLVGLAASGLLVLLLHGSQSNHVLLELAVALAVLLTAPVDSVIRRQPSSVDSHPPGTATARAMGRRAWSTRLTLAMRAILVALFACTGFAKLNDDWHSPHLSCCVQMFVGSIAGVVDMTRVPPLALRALPFAATGFELAFPLALLYAMRIECSGVERLRRRAVSLLRTLATLGATFHILTALPPPPISVYPFAMLMAPIYISALVPNDVAAASAAVVRASPYTKVVLAAALAAAAAVALQLSRQSDRFEYPPYMLFSWELGVLWVLAAFGALVAAAAAAAAAAGGGATGGGAAGGGTAGGGTAKSVPQADQQLVTRNRRDGGVRTALALLPAALILLVSSCTYLGIRTYPSFAMFSNLAVEGGASNHWLIGPSRHGSSGEGGTCVWAATRWNTLQHAATSVHPPQPCTPLPVSPGLQRPVTAVAAVAGRRTPTVPIEPSRFSPRTCRPCAISR